MKDALSALEKCQEQNDISDKIQKNYQCYIIRSKYEPYILYSLKDVGNILGYMNIRTVNLSEKEKFKIKKDSGNKFCGGSSGGNQFCTFIDFDGLMKVLSKCRKSNKIQFCERVGILVDTLIFTCIEADTIKCIKTTFKDEDMTEQYIVDKFRIDLYFPQYLLAIECDENHQGQMAKDDVREKFIKNNLLGCTFIRYNPYAEDFSIFAVLNDIFKHIINNRRL
jgi:very-short-patch-repair endonuclease